jgi:hypothetical protein
MYGKSIGVSTVILVGWKQIAKGWGFGPEDIQVTRRRARRWKMPYFRDGDKPAIDEQVLKRWWGKALENMPNDIE